MNEKDELGQPAGKAELGWLVLYARQLSEPLARLPASIEQASRDVGTGLSRVSTDLQHATEVFAPILAELTSELKGLRRDIREGAQTARRSARALVAATVALVFATLVMAWPMWFPRVASQATSPPAVSTPAPRSK